MSTPSPRTSRRPAVGCQDRARWQGEGRRGTDQDESVATEVTTALLRRPDAAFKAMGDDTARHWGNRAQAASRPARTSRRTHEGV
ncbi:DUF6192 family protein [Streptomyces filipinensis]|uniref:DUF6192 family protein n=1 Tax=Streptomyces filipinensis TaxID=66887 RepID=UPI0036EF61DD